MHPLRSHPTTSIPSATPRSEPRSRRVALAALTSSVLAAMATPSTAQPGWSQLPTSAAPGARYAHALAYDMVRDRVVLFGGATGHANVYLGDTWEFDGQTWRPMKPASAPPARRDCSLTYDPVRRTCLLFGGGSPGLYSDTWEWNGSSWTALSPTASPSTRASHAVAYDPNRQRVVLFGGQSNIAGNQVLGDTWEWDGTQWLQRKVTGPRARGSAAMVFDPSRNTVVLFGGYDGAKWLDDTWEWNGTTWKQLAPPQPPSPRSSPAASYDLRARRALLYGGIDGTMSGMRDTWSWDDDGWSAETPATAPAARYGAPSVYDSRRGRHVLYGGLTKPGTGTFLADTWVYAFSLTADVHTVSVGTGGTVQFALDAGPVNNGNIYLMLGSAAGTKPGITLPPNLVLRLNPEPVYFDYTLGVHDGLLAPGIGFLLGGRGACRLALPRLPPSLIGVNLQHAFVAFTFQPPWGFVFASNPVPVTLGP